MENKKFLNFCLILFFSIHNVIGVDRRLQNANVDFLNIEGNRRPSPPLPAPNNPLLQNVNPKVTPAPISTTKVTTPTSPVKQLINSFNDKIADNQNQGSRPSSPTNQGEKPNFPSTSGQQSTSTVNTQNKQSNPIVPNQPAQIPPQPNRASVQPNPNPPNQGSVQPMPFPNRGVPQSIPNTPGHVSPQPSNPANISPNAPKVPPPSQPSWSSVVSGNKQGGATQPHSLSPGNTPKTAQNLQPIDIGGGWPLPGGTTRKPEERGPEILSDQELKDLSEALYNKDSSNLARLVTINYQGKTTSFSKTDVSPNPLFTIQPALWNIPTVAKMKVLYDNYEQDATVNEHVTALERNEENEFLDAVMATSVMRHLMSTLRDKGVVTPDAKQQKDALKTIWFSTYSRGQGKIGSSGFEHIFLSEIKNNQISGLHNWIYFSSEESKNNVNYLGFMQKTEFDKGAILKLHFTMKDIDKPVATMFIGTSPELELALYSLCFMTRVDRDCRLSLGGQTFNLRTHNFRYRGKNMIGSGFPEL